MEIPVHKKHASQHKTLKVDKYYWYMEIWKSQST